MTVFRTIISRATRPAKTSTNADKHTAYDRNNWRIQYKIAMLVNKCLRGPPPYLAELYWPVVHLTGRRHLRSAASGKLDVQRTATATGRRNFAVSGPETWNSLPASRYNRGFYRHRIANFPNYVTLTSSLTHHRIVNLGAHGTSATYVSNFTLLRTH